MPGAGVFMETELFRERHPWVRDDDIRPKGIAREMAEAYASFDDFVKRNQLARMEGLLLRYLSQVWNALSHNVPSAATFWNASRIPFR